MNELFPEEKINSGKRVYPPLADRMRPAKLGDVAGQSHLIAEGQPLSEFFSEGEFPSIIFWGPPGVGKTTLAFMIADQAGYTFRKISAIDSGVKDLREIISEASRLYQQNKKTLLFIDEIHRFNKSQQDSLLNAVEKGILTLIGATTENPSFEINAALLSRCQVYRLLPLEDEDIRKILERALNEDELLSKQKIIIDDWDFLVKISGGDARTALNALELSHRFSRKNGAGEIVITRAAMEKALQQKTAQYDKKGETHYDTISAFIKSLRGSDPDAALFWLAKMIESGEEPRFIARRMVVFASEDIGNAEPTALLIAVAAFQAVEMIGLPECAINLAHCVTFLASCPKSNSSYFGLKHALNAVKQGAPLSVPLHLRNAPTKLMKQEGYGAEYKYPHSFPGHFIPENYFPAGYEPPLFYKPGNFGKEKEFAERLKKFWGDRYNKPEKPE